jgi:omega-amidase
MEKVSISLAQMHLVLGQPIENLKCAVAWIEEAAKRGSSLILFPELWSTSYDLSNSSHYIEQNKELLTELSLQAKRNHIWIAGSLIQEQNHHFYNTLYIHSPEGTLSTEYSKIHLFRLMEEDHWLQAGNTLQTAPLPWGAAGLAICYDLRFPELFRQYALSGASSVLLPAEWPLRRIEHWKTLLRARAIEEQMFVIATNCVGLTGDEIFGGCSAVIDPWGETIIEGNSSEPELLTSEIDLDQVEKVRSTIPIFQDRRPDLYVI